MTADRGYLTPETLPSTRLCRRLSIPDDPLILAAVTGALSELLYASNWQPFGSVTVDQIVEAMNEIYDGYIAGSVCMIGAVVAFANLNPPDGTLICDGTTYTKEAYPELWEAIDTSMRTSTHFTVPDLTGKVISMDGYDGNANHDFGESYGAGAVTQSTFDLATHNHNTHTHIELLALGPGELPVASLELPGGATDNAGDGNAFAIYQPTLALRYFIIAR